MSLKYEPNLDEVDGERSAQRLVPETRNSRPETRNPKPETRDPRPET